MAKVDSILAIDIGGDSLKIGEFIYPQETGGALLEKFAFAEYDLEQVDNEGMVDAFTQAFHRLLEENDFSAKKVRVSLSGQSAFIRLAKLPPIGDKEARVHQIVEYEARQTVPFPMDEVIWDYQLLQHDQPVITPAGGNDEDEENADELEDVVESSPGDMEAIFVVIKNEFVVEIAKVIEEAGKDILSIEVAPTACFNAARANLVGVQDCEMILNIGGRCSSLIFADRGRIFVRTIPIAGHSVTQQISKEFGIPFADAEELKRRHGFVALGGAYEEPDSEVAATVSKIVRNVMTRLHGEINRSINVYRSQHGGKRPVKMYLSGGSSVMEFTPRFFNEKLRIPVDYLNSFQVVGISDHVDKVALTDVAHVFVEVIGLALRHVVDCPIEISLIPDAIKRIRELNAKKPYFYATCASLILCLLLTLWGVERRLGFDKQRVEIAKGEVTKTSSLVDQVGKAMGELKSEEKKYDDALAILKARQKWINILNELQKVLPDRVWLTSIEGQTDKEAEQASEKRRERGRRRSQDAPPDDLFGGSPFGAEAFGPMEGGARKQEEKIVKQDIVWLKLEGHSLIMKKDELLVEMLRKRLADSKLFTDNQEEIIDVKFEGYKGQGDNNIRYFALRVKLKEAIQK